MPHHSAQQQQFLGSSSAPFNRVSVGAPQSATTNGKNVSAMDFCFQPQHASGSPDSTNQNAQQWKHSPARSDVASDRIHQVLETSPVQSATRNDYTPRPGHISISTSRSQSFESARGIAASALLLAASGSQKHKVSSNDSLENEEEEFLSSVPLKKRKKVSDIMRKQQQSSDSGPCHVSPNSHCTKGDAHMDGTESAHHRGPSSASASAASRSSSYDMKEAQVLSESAKVADTRDIIVLPTHVDVPHFPSILYSVLTHSPFANSVLMWLPHGKAWKIVRFDALRRQVLPKYFPQLREDDGAVSLDAFLWHLNAWGFEEITDGPDIGAYTHVLFRRGLPQLYEDMKIQTNSNRKGALVDDRVKQQDSRSILQVPSLISTAGNTSEAGSQPSTPPRDHNKPDSPCADFAWAGRDITSHQQQQAGEFLTNNDWYHQHPPPHSAQSFHHHRHHMMAASQGMRMPHQNNPGMSINNPYPAARVRSGRGAARASTRFPAARVTSSSTFGAPPSTTAPEGATATVATTATNAPTRPSFPVSNRGRSRRVSLPAIPNTSPAEAVAPNVKTNASAVPTTAVTPVTTTSTTKTNETRDRPRSVLTRKLPMSKNNPTAAPTASKIQGAVVSASN